MKADKLINIIEKSVSNFQRECLTTLQKDDYIVSKNELLVTDELIKIYYDRYQLQKSLKKDEVKGYENLIENLEDIKKGTLIEMITIYTISNCYMYFITKSNVLISVLKSTSSNLIKFNQLIVDYPIYYNGDYQFYINGKEVTKVFFSNIHSPR